MEYLCRNTQENGQWVLTEEGTGWPEDSEKNYLSHYVSFVSNLVLSANTVYSKKILN